MEKEVKDGRGLTQAAAESIVADADERIRYRQELRDRAVSKINEFVANLQLGQDAMDFLDAVEVQVQEDGKPIVPRFIIDQAFFDLSDEGRLFYDRVTMTVSRPAEMLDSAEVEATTAAIAQTAVAEAQGSEASGAEGERRVIKKPQELSELEGLKHIDVAWEVLKELLSDGGEASYHDIMSRILQRGISKERANQAMYLIAASGTVMERRSPKGDNTTLLSFPRFVLKTANTGNGQGGDVEKKPSEGEIYAMSPVIRKTKSATLAKAYNIASDQAKESTTGRIKRDSLIRSLAGLFDRDPDYAKRILSELIGHGALVQLPSGDLSLA